MKKYVLFSLLTGVIAGPAFAGVCPQTLSVDHVDELAKEPEWEPKVPAIYSGMHMTGSTEHADKYKVLSAKGATARLVSEVVKQGNAECTYEFTAPDGHKEILTLNHYVADEEPVDAYAGLPPEFMPPQ